MDAPERTRQRLLRSIRKTYGDDPASGKRKLRVAALVSSLLAAACIVLSFQSGIFNFNTHTVLVILLGIPLFAATVAVAAVTRVALRSFDTVREVLDWETIDRLLKTGSEPPLPPPCPPRCADVPPGSGETRR